MAIKLFGLTIATAAQTAAAAAALAPVVDRVVAALKQTEIGDAVADSVKALTSSKLSGAEKFDRVVAETVPRIIHYAAGGGIPAVMNDAEHLARQLVQSVFNDTKAGGLATLLGLLLRKLKL